MDSKQLNEFPEAISKHLVEFTHELNADLNRPVSIETVIADLLSICLDYDPESKGLSLLENSDRTVYLDALYHRLEN